MGAAEPVRVPVFPPGRGQRMAPRCRSCPWCWIRRRGRAEQTKGGGEGRGGWARAGEGGGWGVFVSPALFAARLWSGVGGSSKGVGVPRVWWALQLGGHLLIPLFERLGGEGVPASFPPTPQGVAP